MRQPNKKFNTIVGIVCEGTETENQYLYDLIRSEAFNKGRFKIIPKIEEEDSPVRAKTVRAKKKIKEKASDKKSYHEIEEDSEKDYKLYKSQPLRYVREAFLMQEEYGCNEVWAVFDKDIHPAHEEAFAYATDNNVGIAFNSLAFEQWVLLHFEKSGSLFSKIECKEKIETLKNNKRSRSKTETKTIGCGKTKDCLDNIDCLCAYIRRNYISDYSKKDPTMYDSHLKGKLLQAIENAAWLRQKYDNTKTPIYELNPYTNMDKFISRLFEIGKNQLLPSIQWFDIRKNSLIAKKLKLAVTDGILTVHNQSKITQKIDRISLSDEYAENEHCLCSNIILPAEETKEINIATYNKAHLRINYSNTYYISTI